MKFSHSLKYNAVPEWQDYYIDYSHLKKLIYSLQQQELDQLNGGSNNKAGSSSKSNKLSSLKFWKKNGFEDDSDTGIVSGSGFGKNSGGDDDANVETIELGEYPNTKKSSKKSKFGFDFDKRSSVSSERTIFNSQDVFLAKLTDEKRKIDDFYKRLEAKLYSKFETLTKDLENAGFANLPNHLYNEAFEAQSLSGVATRVKSNETVFSGISRRLSVHSQRGHGDEEDSAIDEEEEEDDDDNVQDNTALLNYADYNLKSQKRSILKKNVIDLYVDLAQLKSFIELNRIGFSKISKKFDKVLSCTIKRDLIESGEFFNDAHIFLPDTITELDNKISHLISYYAVITDQEDDLQTVKDELRSYLRDFIVWERNTVWKDLLGLESQQNDFTSVGRPAVNGEISALENITHLEYYSYTLPKPINIKFTTIEKLSIPKIFFTMKALKIYLIIIFTIILLAVRTFHDEAQHRCMALVECVALLWATEAIPLFVTAMLVPLLVVLFRVLKTDTGQVMNAVDASSLILSKMWSSTIMVLLAGFTLAAALSKYNIAKVLASYLLTAAGVKPRNVLIVVMGVVFFLSMWISNVAAPVLTYSLIQTVLRTLDSEAPFAKALVLGVALSANVGGMASPISSPQNVIAMDYLKVYGIGWGNFFAVAIPVSIVAVVLIWILLILTFKINTSTLKPYKPIKEQFTLKQYYIIAVTLATILLWCVLSKIELAFGSAGQIAVIPIVLFFGTGLLTTHDINNFPWSIVILAMGGIALGAAVSSSGLLGTIAGSLQKRVMDYPTYAILCIFGIVMLVVGTFVSHTVSAIIIIPLVQEIGDKLPSGNAAPILVFGCTLLASCGMGLASSGFPNVTAISMTDEVGNRYLTVNNFITRGVPASLLAFIVVITIGYGIMSSVLHG
ncbi:Pho87/Pho90 [Kluyveromyces lactis]|nr:Pho87/Pho90 [Kluyveromyces lactis]